MLEDNGVQKTNLEKTLTWIGMVVLILLVLVVLGGMLYAFLIPVP